MWSAIREHDSYECLERPLNMFFVKKKNAVYNGYY